MYKYGPNAKRMDKIAKTVLKHTNRSVSSEEAYCHPGKIIKFLFLGSNPGLNKLNQIKREL